MEIIDLNGNIKGTIEDLIIRENDFLINVFPTNKTGFVVTLDEFIRDLKDELKNYE